MRIGSWVGSLILVALIPSLASPQVVKTISAADFPEGTVISRPIQGITLSGFMFDPAGTDPMAFFPLTIGKPPHGPFPDNGQTGYEGFAHHSVFLPSTSNLGTFEGTHEGVATGISLSTNRLLRGFGLTAFSGSGADVMLVMYFDRHNALVGADYVFPQERFTEFGLHYEYQYELKKDLRFSQVLFGATDSATFIHSVWYTSAS